MTTSTTTSTTSEVNLNQSAIGYRGYCGYCAQEKTRVSTWLTFPKLSMEHYLDLLNIGWGRYMDSYSVTHLQQSCCKVFAHRLDITKFTIRPSQRKVIKKWEKFLADKTPHKKPKIQQEKVTEVQEGVLVKNPEEKKQEGDKSPEIQIAKIMISKDEEEVITEKAKLQYHISKLLKLMLSKKCEVNKNLGLLQGFHLTMSEKAQEKVKVLPANSKKYGQYSSNLLLILYSENKQMLSDAEIPNIGIFLNKVYKYVIPKISASPSFPFAPTIQPNGYISFTKQEIQVPSRFSSSFLSPKNLFTKISRVFFSSPQVNIPPPYDPKVEKIEQEKPKKPKTSEGTVTKDKVGYFDLELEANCEKFEIKFVKAEYDPEAWEVYGRHCDARFPNKKESSKSEKTFREFLCYPIIKEQNIESEILDEEGKPKILQIGCYHMKYYLEGKLIAMGVLDIIPTGMQSVYFFYDPDYSDLVLGAVGVLKEIDYMTRLQKYFPEFKYYYLSDYIQNCQRVKYKVEYEPAELLCPGTRTWVKFDERVRGKIDRGVLWLADAKVKVIDDFEWKEFDKDQFVIENAKVNSQKYLEFDPEYAEKLMNAMKSILCGLGKKLFSEIEFKIEIKKPEVEAEKAEAKEEKTEEKVEEKVEKVEEKKAEENIEEDSMGQKDKAYQVRPTSIHSIRFNPPQNNTLARLNSI